MMRAILQLVLLSAFAALIGACGVAAEREIVTTADARDRPASILFKHRSTVKRTAADGTIIQIPYFRRGAGPGNPALLVLDGPFCIEWFGRHLETALDVVYFLPLPDSLLLSERVADVEAVRSGLLLETVYVLGHSDNGAVAIEYAAAHPDRVAGIVWIAGLSDHQQSIRLQLEALARKTDDEQERRFYDSLAAKDRLNVLDSVVAMRSRLAMPACRKALPCMEGFARGGATMQAVEWEPGAAGEKLADARSPLIAAATPDIRGQSFVEYSSLAAASSLTDVPVLLIQGDADTTVYLEPAQALAKALPKGELVVFEGNNHIPFLEDPDRFVAELKRFFNLDRETAPTPSVLDPDWGSPVPSDLSAEEREAQAAQKLVAVQEVQIVNMFVTTCIVLAEISGDDDLQSLGITAAEREEFVKRFCKAGP